jgi:hypothetical protein
VATLNFTGTDHKTFTSLSTALSNLRNSTAGTMIMLVKQTTTGSTDFCGLLDSTDTSFFHSLLQGFTASALGDDDGVASTTNTTWPQNTTDWYFIALDWSATVGTADNFHWKDQTTLGSWTHSAAAGANNAAAGTSAGSTGHFRLGAVGDFSTGAKDMGICAVWSGTRFANGDYGSWTKTSDLYNHSLGHPTFLCEITATTPVDLMGAATYASGSSAGTTLTGANPDNWTFDGLGSTAVALPGVRRGTLGL